MSLWQRLLQKAQTAVKKTSKKTTKKKTAAKKNLVIVESPAKAKTIEKYLGRNYKVVASVGHIRDLKKSSMSIDFEITINRSISISVVKVL